MTWLEDAVEITARRPVCDYKVDAPGSSEPTALAALALADVGRIPEALLAGDFLASLQSAKGCIGMRQKEDWPHWPTSLALLAWLRLDARRFAVPIERALPWTFSVEGERIPKDPHAGHNTQLAAWPWVEGTHSWMEPSALFTLALKAHGQSAHPRTQEAVTLLIDRLLPGGGCNYGNTSVLGQELRPHVQPSGIVMLALAGERDVSGRVDRTLTYLQREVAEGLTPNTLAWAMLGLAAHGKSPANAAAQLERAYAEVLERTKSPYSIVLLMNAALGERSSLIALTQRKPEAKPGIQIKGR